MLRPALVLAALVCGCGPREEAQPAAAPAVAEPAPPELVVAEPTRTLRVLYLEDEPRWEYRYLRNKLVRGGERIRTQTLLFAASPGFVHDHSAGVPALERLPREPRQVFAYDVILLGDVPPEKLGSDATEVKQWLDLLVEFVGNGGGLGLLCGPRAMPELYRGTPLETLLPMTLDEPPREWTVGEYRPAPPATDTPHTIAHLRRDVGHNQSLWDDRLPALTTRYPVEPLRAESVPVLVATRRAPDPQPVFAAVRSHQLGRVFLCATDETWRWRFVSTVRFHDAFWTHVVVFLAGP